MAQHVVGHGADVLGHDVSAALDESVGAGGLGQIDGCTRRTAERYHVLHILQAIAVGIARGEDDVGNVLLNLLVQIHLAYYVAGRQDFGGGRHGAHLRQRLLDVFADNLLLLVDGGIADDHFQHETVHLRLGQRIGSLLLDGVLRGHHQERVRQFERVAADGHLLLLHGFEQGALHLRRGTVDFVRQHEVGEYGTALHLEFFLFLRVDHRTRDVRRQQVRRELYALISCVNQLCQRLDSQRLGQSGDTLQQDVAVAQQTNKQ